MDAEPNWGGDDGWGPFSEAEVVTYELAENGKCKW